MNAYARNPKRAAHYSARAECAYWQASGELTPSDSQRLAQTMRVSPFDWRHACASYAFWPRWPVC